MPIMGPRFNAKIYHLNQFQEAIKDFDYFFKAFFIELEFQFAKCLLWDEEQNTMFMQ